MAAAAAAVKFDVTSNFKSSRKELEREAVDSFRELERAEKAAGIPELGKRFGKAMADLNENLEHGEWMKTLDRLGITYRKAQYWMHIYKGKTPTGSRSRTDEGRFDWEAATDWLHQLKSKVSILANSKPQGADGFAEELTRLAAAYCGGGCSIFPSMLYSRRFHFHVYHLVTCSIFPEVGITPSNG